MQHALLPRQVSVLLIAMLACGFAANHIAARIAFDDGTGLLLAVLSRSGITGLALAAVVAWRRIPVTIDRPARKWLLLVGLLVTLQSLCIYSAVARIPVGLALLLVNLSPVCLALITWFFGGAPPSKRVTYLMMGIFSGLLIVLDLPALLNQTHRFGDAWLLGVTMSLVAAVVFAVALWVIQNRLHHVEGTLRSTITMLLVFTGASVAGALGAIPGGLALPQSLTGWTALACVVFFYGSAISTLFILMPRLDIARNAPVMNIEPVAGLLMGWLILGQTLDSMQLVGAAIVLGGVALLAMRA